MPPFEVSDTSLSSVAPSDGGSPRRKESSRFSAHEFGLELPEGWENQTIYRLEGPTNEGMTPQITVEVEHGPEETTSVDFAQVNLQAQRETGTFRSILNDRFLELNFGGRAYWVVVFRVRTGGPDIVADQLYLVQKGTGFRMTVIQPSDRSTMCRDAVERLFKSFEPHPRSEAV